MLCACGATQGVGGGESRRSQTTALARHAGSRVGPHRVRQEYFGPLGRVAVGGGGVPSGLSELVVVQYANNNKLVLILTRRTLARGVVVVVCVQCAPRAGSPCSVSSCKFLTAHDDASERFAQVLLYNSRLASGLSQLCSSCSRREPQGSLIHVKLHQHVQCHALVPCAAPQRSGRPSTSCRS